jgi:hypothetical protein
MSLWSCFYDHLVPTSHPPDVIKPHSTVVCAVGIIFAYSMALLCSIVICLYCEDEFNPHRELVDIAASFSLDAGKITKLLQVPTVTFCMAEVFVLCAYANLWSASDS